MENERTWHGFHLEINSLNDFLAFCAVIRGEELDATKIREQMQLLKGATTELDNAVKANPEPST